MPLGQIHRIRKEKSGNIIPIDPTGESVDPLGDLIEFESGAISDHEELLVREQTLVRYEIEDEKVKNIRRA